MVVRPVLDQATSQVRANTTFLCPSFEAERARLLDMPFTEEIQIVPWEEHWDPYSTLQQSDVFLGVSRVPRLMVDEEMRDFIQRGLGSAGFEVVGLRGQVEEVRQIKTAHEVEILRAVNTGTVEAVREMRKCESKGNSARWFNDVFSDKVIRSLSRIDRE
jgi:Xaa-Pro aminopeptidase